MTNNPAKICEMKQVESSQINRVGYIKKGDCSGYLFIEFKPNSKYLYHPVSDKTYQELMSADSIGGYFHKNIKNCETITCIKIPE